MLYTGNNKKTTRAAMRSLSDYSPVEKLSSFEDMPYSALACSGVVGYFKILEKFHYTRPIRWNSKKGCLEVNPSSQKIKN
jgi:hypothetical protein